jgi:hypothetical protein
MTTRIALSILLLTCFIAAQAATDTSAPAASNTAASASARVVSDFGILVDSANAQQARDGLRVLAATPGSPADELGLRPGDLLVDVNGTSLRNLGADADGRALAATVLKSRLGDVSDTVPLRLQVVRDGVTLVTNLPVRGGALPTLGGELAAASMASIANDPAAPVTTAGCGRISTFDVAPRNEHMYHAIILLLDGTTPGPSGQKNYRVAAGEHHLLVAEDIPTLQMGVGEIATLRRDTKKALTVIVKPNTLVMIAAQLHPDKATEFSTGAYWDPVAWREIPQACP